MKPKPPVLIGTFIFMLAVAGKYFLLERQPPKPQTLLTVQAVCDLHQAPCTATDGAGHTLSFSLSPNTIPLMKPLIATVAAGGVSGVQSAHISVEGVNMFMGIQQEELLSEAGNRWQGQFLLPVCSNQNMQWKAQVTVQTAAGEWLADFPFETVRP